MAQAPKSATKLNIKNKRATFEYELLLHFKAGLQLTGTEIKSIRAGKASIAEAYCVFVRDELYIRNMTIEEYSFGNIYNHEPKRDRKLLLQKHELHKLTGKLKDKGLTIVPLELYINENGFAKVDISLAKGKKMYDKRASLKDKVVKRDMARVES
jgi:SsrA-binding protein